MDNSLLNPSVGESLKAVEDRYSLVIVTSRRARQIIDGAVPLTTVPSNKALTIAINEVNEGKISYCKNNEGTK